MAYDETLAKRISELTRGKKGFTHKELFGGIAYLLNGNMYVRVNKEDLIIRYNPELTEEVTNNKHVRPFLQNHYHQKNKYGT
jgi:hypothetical protein